MFGLLRRQPEFHITHESEPSDVLLAGFSTYGLAGLTAVDYLVEHLDLRETGHIRAEGFPSITPFTDGRPRHPTRIFSRPDLDVSILVGELFVPASLGDAFASEILEWTMENDVSEIAVLSGVPVPHGPEGHRTFYIATDDYREARLANLEIPAMTSGFLDGTNAALLERGIESPLGVAVYVTPVHSQIPDVEAAIRLVETVEQVYDLEIDSGPLKQFAEEVAQHYAELADHMENQETDMPEDRMYM